MHCLWHWRVVPTTWWETLASISPPTSAKDTSRHWDTGKWHSFSSVQFHSVVSNSLWPHGLQHTRPPCLPPTPGVNSNSCPLSLWCHPMISSSVVHFSSHLQSFPASGSFPISQFFISGGRGTGVSASVSVLPVNIQGWFPLRLTGLISLQSKRLSRIFSNTTVKKHQFFGAHLSLQSNSHICFLICCLGWS